MSRKIIGVTVGTTINPKKLAGGASEEQIAQIAKNTEDISQLSSEIANHKHSWNDLEDKPFGETDAIEITWDGNTEGLEYVDIGEDTKVYYISDVVLSNEEVRNSTVEYTLPLTDVTNSISTADAYDVYVSAGCVTDDYVFTEQFVVTRNDNTDVDFSALDGTIVHFPKAGVYFYCDIDNELAPMYISKLATSASIKQLDEKYIPDTICRKEYVDQLLGTNIAEVASLVGGDA